MQAERATLIRKPNQSFQILYTAHGAEFGRSPSYFELHDLPEQLDEDELVTLTCEKGRSYQCRVLDHTGVCAVVAVL